MKRAAISLALLLAGCATVPHSEPDKAAIAEQIADYFRERPDDPTTMAMVSGGNVVRNGRKLLVRTGARSFRFVDRGYCEGFSTCEMYRVDRLLHGRFLGVHVRYGEYPDSYLIIDLARGSRWFDTGERPVPSTQAPLAAVADGGGGDVNSPMIGGLAIVDLERRQVLWHEPEWLLDARIDQWEGPRCVRASYRPGMWGEDNPVRTVWIAEVDGRWQGLGERPAICAAN